MIYGRQDRRDSGVTRNRSPLSRRTRQNECGADKNTDGEVDTEQKNVYTFDSSPSASPSPKGPPQKSPRENKYGWFGQENPSPQPPALDAPLDVDEEPPNHTRENSPKDADLRRMQTFDGTEELSLNDHYENVASDDQEFQAYARPRAQVEARSLKGRSLYRGAEEAESSREWLDKKLPKTQSTRRQSTDSLPATPVKLSNVWGSPDKVQELGYPHYGAEENKPTWKDKHWHPEEEFVFDGDGNSKEEEEDEEEPYTCPPPPHHTPSAPPMPTDHGRSSPQKSNGVPPRGKKAATTPRHLNPLAPRSPNGIQPPHPPSTWSAGKNPEDNDAVRWPGGVPSPSPPTSPLRPDQSQRYFAGGGGESLAAPKFAMPPALSYSSGQEAWQSVVAYEACVRICLDASERGVPEAQQFLSDGCLTLRTCFGLQQLLLLPGQGNRQGAMGEEADEGPAKVPPKKMSLGVVKLQVRKVRMGAKSASVRIQAVSPGGGKVGGVMRHMSDLLKDRVSNFRTGSPDASQEGVRCRVRLKSAEVGETQEVMLGGNDSLALAPESSADDVLLDVFDMRGKLGSALIPLASITADHMEKLRWVPIFTEGDAEAAGKVQLSLTYIPANADRGSKWGAVGETLAYDVVQAVGLQAVAFRQRQLHLQGPWKWLLSEFASVYGVTHSYAALRYLYHIMEVETPTEDCLLLIYDLLAPIYQHKAKDRLSRQERRMLQEAEEQVSTLVAFTFKHYKSLDETASMGLAAVCANTAPPGYGAPALSPAVMLYELLHDTKLPEPQGTLRGYFQEAARKRCYRHLKETDDLVLPHPDAPYDSNSAPGAYAKMRLACLALCNEIRTDISIQNQHIFPSFVDLPTITSAVYVAELGRRLRDFLRACPPRGPTPAVADLLHAAADLQHDLGVWGIGPVGGGLDARELFGGYMKVWIQDFRQKLLDRCKAEVGSVAAAAVPVERHATSPFVEEMYGSISVLVGEYDGIMSRWPEMAVTLEEAVCDVERGVIAALDRVNAEFMPTLKESGGVVFSLSALSSKLGGKKSGTIYTVPPQMGVFLNTIKRLLESLRPNMENQMRVWGATLNLAGHDPSTGQPGFGDRLGEVTVELRAKYKNTMQAMIDKLAENAELQRTTRLLKLLKDTQPQSGDDISKRMQRLTALLSEMVVQLDTVLSGRVFVGVVRGMWDRQAREVLQFLENRKENTSWFKSSSAGIALEILDRLFTSHMQRLQGHAIQEKDLEPPRNVLDARSMLAVDGGNSLTDSYSIF